MQHSYQVALTFAYRLSGRMSVAPRFVPQELHSPALAFAEGVAPAFEGAVLFALPLMMTMEVR